jgi:enamine deaminase RidA (YjgF/YER057c/UK114 family)
MRHGATLGEPRGRRQITRPAGAALDSGAFSEQDGAPRAADARKPREKANMSFRQINPSDIAEPINKVYSQGIVVPAGADLLFTAGQVGLRKDGTLPADITEQARQVWENLSAILRDAGMGITDIVKMTAFVVGKENFPKYAEVRKAYLRGHRPASTAFFVPALVSPEMLIEVELIAAKKA